jgi:hypothetical protein
VNYEALVGSSQYLPHADTIFQKKGTYMDNIEKLYIYKETIKDNQLFSKCRVKTNEIVAAIFSSIQLQHIPNRPSDITNKKHDNNQL